MLKEKKSGRQTLSIASESEKTNDEIKKFPSRPLVRGFLFHSAAFFIGKMTNLLGSSSGDCVPSLFRL